jgi:MoxR-like ATPase
VPNLDEKPTLAEQLLDLFHETRQYEMIAKKPSISEAIVWIDAIMSSFPDKKLKKKDLLPYWGILFKKRDDLRFAVETLAVNTK